MPNKKRVFLIDFENVGSAGVRGIELLYEEDSVVIFCSANAANISIDLALGELARTPADVSYYNMTVRGKNSLDFQLCTYLGYIISENSQSEEDYEYIIISKDQGFDAVLDFWSSDSLASKADVKRLVSIQQAEKGNRGKRGKKSAQVKAVTPVPVPKPAPKPVVQSLPKQQKEITKPLPHEIPSAVIAKPSQLQKLVPDKSVKNKPKAFGVVPIKTYSDEKEDDDIPVIRGVTGSTTGNTMPGRHGVTQPVTGPLVTGHSVAAPVPEKAQPAPLKPAAKTVRKRKPIADSAKMSVVAAKPVIPVVKKRRPLFPARKKDDDVK